MSEPGIVTVFGYRAKLLIEQCGTLIDVTRAMQHDPERPSNYTVSTRLVLKELERQAIATEQGRCHRCKRIDGCIRNCRA